MRRISLIVVALLGLVVMAASPASVDNVLRIMKGGFQVGPAATLATSSNKVTAMLGASGTIDFVSATTTCTTTISDGGTATLAVTGAAVGDPCFVGTPASPAANSSFSCYVSATDTVTLKQCAAGTASDPSSGTYYVRVVSSQ